ncbi:hypothetical protein M758_1G057800 [Ceratodon purpureus]|uniref:Uncharacterized protein n=1 Tax=Ceratodon purpureus TaxID=3225 RepID=A0A8T0J588_CERPU|nr:hypothetical protein KC19_1G059500 [Ceratodon purpureus]KAG0628865.1 hypothetical protein M758_1G057800 [Ceratodon purpureus]
MATATQRAAIGAEEARMEGKGPGGRAAEAARNAVTGRDQPGVGPFNDGVHHDGTHLAGVDGTHVGERGLFDHHHHENGGMLEHTEEEMARLRNRTHITHESEAYCPNPNIRDLPKEFETRVQVIQRYPEMKTVEKTDFVKEIHHEERTIIVPKTRMIYDEIERIDRVPVVKQVPKTRIEIVYRVVEEEREVTDMVPVVEYMDVPRIEQVPRVITEDVEEIVTVPVVREVPVTRMVEVPTGNYCEAPVGEFVNPGDFDLLHHKHGGHHHDGGHKLGHLLNRTSSSSSSSSSDDGSTGRDAGVAIHHNADGTINHAGRHKKRPGLLQRIIHH